MVERRAADATSRSVVQARVIRATLQEWRQTIEQADVLDARVVQPVEDVGCPLAQQLAQAGEEHMAVRRLGRGAAHGRRPRGKGICGGAVEGLCDVGVAVQHEHPDAPTGQEQGDAHSCNAAAGDDNRR